MALEIVSITTQEQLKEALQIRKEVFVEEQHVPLEEEIDGYDQLGDQVHHLLVFEGDRAVATARLIYYDDATAKLQRIAVLKEDRSKGYGRVILLALEQRARELGLRFALLDAQCQALGFYEKLGYITISDEPFDDAGIPHVRMQKEL